VLHSLSATAELLIVVLVVQTILYLTFLQHNDLDLSPFYLKLATLVICTIANISTNFEIYHSVLELEALTGQTDGRTDG